MRILLTLAVASIATAQSPQLAGVWKADLTASQFPGNRAPAQYLELITQSGSKVSELTGTSMPGRTSRSELEFNTAGQPVIQQYDGVPSRASTENKNGKLVVTVETDGQPDVSTRTYELSADGNQLSVLIQTTRGGHEMQTHLVLQKQPDAAGDPLRQAPPAAATVFKNLKTPLKDLNSQQFIDNMHYFAWALHKDCEFCHVQRDFASDDKKEKRIARAMIEMNNGINQNTFKGKQEVACFTCHQFHEHPEKRPLFSGEKPEEHEHQGAE